MTEQKEIKTIELITKKDKFTRPIHMIFYSDGAVAFSTDMAETFVYLYPDVVKKVSKKLANFCKVT
jgi:hypothetical protein